MKQFLLTIFAFLLFISSCNNENPVEPKKTAPTLIKITVPDTLFLSWNQQQKITVKADDPQGLSDIKAVFCKVLDNTSSEIIKIDTLFDNGTNGDIIPGDGEYCTILSEQLTDDRTGIFNLVFQAEDRQGEFSAESTHKLVVVKGMKNKVPTIQSVIAPDSIDIAVEQSYLVTCLVSDPEGLSDIKRVTCDIYLTTDLEPFFSDTLTDNGTNGDQIAGDGIFSFVLASDFANSKVRKHILRFRVYDLAGNRSSIFEKAIQTYNSANQPPVISNLVAPDTMIVPSHGAATAILTVDVNDTDGLSDIRDVYMNVYKPDGSGSSMNPLSMEDDGSIGSGSGDKVANDGTYSLGISLPTGTTKGTYRFVFEAVDYSNVKSNQIEHFILVK